MSVSHATVSPEDFLDFALSVENVCDSIKPEQHCEPDQTQAQLLSIVAAMRRRADDVAKSIESLPRRIAELAGEYYTADDRVLDQEKVCKALEDKALKLIMSQKAENSDRPLHGSDVKRREATKSYLAKSQEYAEARELLVKLLNGRNAVLVELEEARNILAVRLVAVKRELIAAWQLTMDQDRKEGV